MTYVINPYRFGWVYASLAAAEASGDPWGDGDTIRINGGATFLYYTALETNGHSGLIHKFPYDDTDEISAVALRKSEGPGVDPDSWGGSSWDYSLAITTKGVDYDFDTASSRSRLRKLTNTGRSMIINTDVADNDTEMFCIMRDLKCVTTIVSGSALWSYCMVYVDASNYDQAFIVAAPGSSANFGLAANSTQYGSISYGTETQCWLYVTDNKCALWFDGAASPLTDTSQSVASARTRIANIGAGLSTVNGTSDVTFSTNLHGGMTTA